MIPAAPLTLAGERILLVCPQNLRGNEAALAEALAQSGAELTVVAPDLDLVKARPRGARIVALGKLRQLRWDWTPALVVYASAPSWWLHARVWWWKRRRARRALLGGIWDKPVKEGIGTRFALASQDFFLVENDGVAAALRERGVYAGRVLVVSSAAMAPEFLARRKQAENRSALWVEEDISLNSPSAKHLVYSIPHLQAEGWEIRLWCLTADDAAKAAGEVHYLPAVPERLKIFQPYWFFAVANWHGIKRTIIEGRSPARLVHTMGGAFLGADFAMIQFVNHVWLRKQWELGVGGFKGWLMFGWTILAMLKDQLQFSNPRCRVFLPASDSIGDEVRCRCHPRAEVRTLANSYDETRFNPAVRRQWRELMRRELGFGDGDTVFSFASQGHYKRKGFWLAVEALARLRRRSDLPKAPGVKFLVIGGQPGTLARLQEEIAGAYPDWKSWVVFVGSQPALEKYFAAADAFLFPSYFEAFCLAEIEAGAMGLPLLLTPHHGTEMILRDGENGLRLEFDVARMVEALAGFLSQGLPTFEPGAGRALNREKYARELARVYVSL